MIRECECPAGNLLIQLLVVLSSERKLATEHSIEKNAARPDISRWADILLLCHYFWTHIRRCAAKDFKAHVIRLTAAKAEVDQFD